MDQKEIQENLEYVAERIRLGDRHPAIERLRRTALALAEANDEIDGFLAHQRDVSEALNRGNGSYHP